MKVKNYFTYYHLIHRTLVQFFINSSRWCFVYKFIVEKPSFENCQTDVMRVFPCSSVHTRVTNLLEGYKMIFQVCLGLHFASLSLYSMNSDKTSQQLVRTSHNKNDFLLSLKNSFAACLLFVSSVNAKKVEDSNPLISGF